MQITLNQILNTRNDYYAFVVSMHIQYESKRFEWEVGLITIGYKRTHTHTRGTFAERVALLLGGRLRDLTELLVALTQGDCPTLRILAGIVMGEAAGRLEDVCVWVGGTLSTECQKCIQGSSSTNIYCSGNNSMAYFSTFLSGVLGLLP